MISLEMIEKIMKYDTLDEVILSNRNGDSARIRLNSKYGMSYFLLHVIGIWWFFLSVYVIPEKYIKGVPREKQFRMAKVMDIKGINGPVGPSYVYIRYYLTTDDVEDT